MTNGTQAIGLAILAGIAGLTVFAMPARAYDIYSFDGGAGGTTKIITLSGGDYELYLDARQDYGSVMKSCFFSGSLSGQSAPYNKIPLGTAIEVSKDDWKPWWRIDRVVTLAPGRYKLWIALETDCYWTFMLTSRPGTTAKSNTVPPPVKRPPCCITRVAMFKTVLGKHVAIETASVNESVRFLADRIPLVGAKDLVFGVYKIRHGDTVIKAGTLESGRSEDNSYDIYYVDVQWDRSSSQYLGKNTIEFITAQGTNSGEFTLKQ